MTAIHEFRMAEIKDSTSVTLTTTAEIEDEFDQIVDAAIAYRNAMNALHRLGSEWDEHEE